MKGKRYFMANIFKKKQGISVESDTIDGSPKKKLKSKNGMSQDGDSKKSKFVIVLYVITGIITAYGAYMVYYTINYIKDYYASYGTSVTDDLANVIQYIISNSVLYFVYALLLFTGARILKRILALQNSIKAVETQPTTSQENL